MTYFMAADGAEIYYEVHGKGLPIIFIHGFSEDNNIFKIQKRSLSKKYRIITYDIRGHGNSDEGMGNLNIYRLSADLNDLIKHLKIRKVSIVAWSMGASVLFEYIRNFGSGDISKICIVDKSPKMLNDKNWNLGLYHGEYKLKDFREDLRMVKFEFLKFCKEFIGSTSTELSKMEFDMALEKMAKNSNKVLYSLWKSMGENDYRNVIKGIDVETLIVFGGRSKLYSLETAEYLSENIKKSKLEIFPESGHLLVLENPRKFNNVIDNFIKRKYI